MRSMVSWKLHSGGKTMRIWMLGLIMGSFDWVSGLLFDINSLYLFGIALCMGMFIGRIAEKQEAEK